MFKFFVCSPFIRLINLSDGPGIGDVDESHWSGIKRLGGTKGVTSENTFAVLQFSEVCQLKNKEIDIINAI